jgi:hypothetical protein
MKYWSCLWTGIGRNGIVGGMRKLKWHIYKFDFCNGISPIGENCNGIDPINPIIKTMHDFFKGSLSNLSHLRQVML